MVCSNCGRQNAPGDRICVSCAAPLAGADAKIICPTCKAENAATERYCIKCGSLLVKTGRPPAPPEPPKPAYTYRTTVRKLDPMPQATVRTPAAKQVPAQQAPAQPTPVQSKPAPAVSVTDPVASFSAQDVAQMDALATLLASKNAVVCTYCGSVNAQADGDCCVCGEPLVREEKPKEKEKETQQPKTQPKPQKSTQAKDKPKIPLHVLIFRKVFGLGKKKDADKAKKGFRFSDKKVLIAAVAVVLALIIVIGAVGSAGSSDAFIYDAVDYKLFYSVGSGQAVLYANGKNVSAENAIEEPKTIYYDMDNTCGIYAMQVQNDAAMTTAVYYFDQKGTTRILDSVNNVIYFSSDGTGVLYIDATAALALYDVEKGTSQVIAENGKYISGAFAISPDGDYVMYGYRNDAGTNSVCIFHEGTKKDVCSSGVPIAVSEGGKKVYYLTVLNNTYDFYATTYRKPAKFTKIASGVYANAIKFNADLSQVLFTLLDGGTYYSKEGKQAQRIASSAMYPLVCNAVNFKSCSGLATVYGVNEFFDHFWIGENGLYYVESGEEPLMLVAGVRDYDLSYDADRLAYIDAEGRLFVTDRKSASDTKTAYAENVTSVAVTGDGKNVYYLNSANALCNLDKDGESAMIAQEVDGIMCSEEGVYYKNISATQDYRLNYCSNAKSGKEVCDSVLSFQISDGCAYYTTGDGQHMYYSKDGNRSFKQLF